MEQLFADIEAEALANEEFVEEQALFLVDLAIETHNKLVADARAEGYFYIEVVPLGNNWEITHPIGKKAWEIMKDMPLEDPPKRASWFCKCVLVVAW